MLPNEIYSNNNKSHKRLSSQYHHNIIVTNMDVNAEAFMKDY
jgi:hypothetical protein